MTARIYALCNQKGGVGKTTSTFHLGRAAVLAGLRVLLVDADPQGNLTQVAGVDVRPDQIGLADVLSGRAPETLADVIVPSIWEGADLVPTPDQPPLEAVAQELVVAGAGREGRLKAELATVTDNYDIVLVDCPPALNLLTINCLTAADEAIIITQTKLFSLNGIGQLLDTIESVREYYNRNLGTAGILVNLHEPRTVSARAWLKELKALAAVQVDRNEKPAPVTVLKPHIRKSEVIMNASEAGRALDEYSHPDAPGDSALYSKLLASLNGIAAVLEGGAR